MTRITVSEIAERHLAQWLEALTDGSLQLWELPPCVAAFYFAGYADGLSTRQTEITYLEHQCDLLYMQAFTPKERQAEYARRLQKHFELEEARFFDQAEEEQHDPGRTEQAA
ncbi:hypothetical protein ACR5KS_02990 [Leucobacter sp. W1153]|uniref:hypothetical protein n=1 Tax=Leucobacter sp. W1153 TaxID=3439064 RepID=UPI003F2E891E